MLSVLILRHPNNYLIISIIWSAAFIRLISIKDFSSLNFVSALAHNAQLIAQCLLSQNDLIDLPTKVFMNTVYSDLMSSSFHVCIRKIANHSKTVCYFRCEQTKTKNGHFNALKFKISPKTEYPNRRY